MEKINADLPTLASWRRAPQLALRHRRIRSISIFMVPFVTPRRAHGLLILTAFLWGLGSVAQKMVLDHVGPLTAAGLSSLLASLVLWPIAHRENRRLGLPARPRIREFAAAALVFSGAVVTLQIAYAGTSVTNAGFLVNTCAALTPLAAWFVLREKPVQSIGPAIVLIFVGAWMISGGEITSFAWGDAICLVSASLFAVSVPLVSRFVLRHGRPAYLTCMQFLVCGLLCTSIGLLIEPFNMTSTVKALPQLALIGVVAKGLAYLSMAIAQQHASASVAAIVVSAEAIFGAICANIFLGEMMTITGAIGAGLILTSIVIVHLSSPFAVYRRSLWL